MSLIAGRCLLGCRVPLVQTLRYRTRKPNLRKPATPHFERAVVLQLTKQFYPAIPKDDPGLCRKKGKAQKDNKNKVNTFEEILAQEFLERVRKAKIVAVFHRKPLTQAEIFSIRVDLNKLKLEYLHYNNTIARLAFSGTEYDALLKLYQSDTATVIGEEANVAKLLKLEKKLSGLVLLAGVVDGRLMSVADLKRYAELPTLDGARGQLLAILKTPAQKLSQNITYHQRELSSALGRYLADQSPPQSETDALAKE